MLTFDPSFAYLLALLGAMTGLVLCDKRFRLALFINWRKTLACVAIGIVFFLAWDIAGVASGIFFIGETRFLSGVIVLPEVPLEELVFLTLLNYNALLLIRAGEKVWPRN